MDHFSLEDISKAVEAALGPQATTGSLVPDIAEIGNAIHRARLSASTRSPKARRERLEHLRKTTAKASQLVDLLQTTTPGIRDQLDVLLSEPVGRYLSVQAFEDAGTVIDTQVSIHTLHSREATMSREGPYRAIEVEVMASRVFTASKCASRVLSSMLVQLKSRIDMQIALMRRAAGGNPGNVYRSSAIRRLADAYYVHLRKAPTTTNTGRFVKLFRAPAI